MLNVNVQFLQTLNKVFILKQQQSKYNRTDVYFFMHCSHFLCWIKFCTGSFRQGFFSFGGQKKWSLVALDRWSSYTVTIVWELAWAVSALVVLDEGLSYRGIPLDLFFTCGTLISIQKRYKKDNFNYYQKPCLHLANTLNSLRKVQYFDARNSLNKKKRGRGRKARPKYFLL